jgi:alpha-L-fucosidase
LGYFNQWMERHSKSIYGCTHAPESIQAPNGTQLTYNPETGQLFMHLTKIKGSYRLKNMAGKVKYARFLHDGSELEMFQKGNDVVFKPKRKYHSTVVPVVEVFGVKKL